MKRYLFLTMLLLSVIQASAQEAQVVIHILEAGSNVPVSNVEIMDYQGKRMARSDSAGYCMLPFGRIGIPGYLLALRSGYAIDTLRDLVPVLYMHPLSVSINNTVIYGNKVSKLLQEPTQYVTDYIFYGNNLIVATFSGDNGRKAKLFLIDKDGSIHASCKIPKEPESLFRSCAGIYYCVCHDVFYPINVSDTSLSLKTPYNIKLLPGLQQCELSVNENRFYRIGDKLNFIMVYGLILKGDTTFMPIKQFEEKDVAEASFGEYFEILAAITRGDFKTAARKQSFRRMWNNGSYSHISIPLLTSGDTVLLFDYFNRKILFFDQAGKSIGQAPIKFEWKQSQQFELLKDEARNKIYIHRYDNKSHQTLEELGISKGMVVSGKILISKPLAENIRIDNGEIYLLWQDSRSGATRQLFVQHEDVASAMSLKQVEK